MLNFLFSRKSENFAFTSSFRQLRVGSIAMPVFKIALATFCTFDDHKLLTVRLVNPQSFITSDNKIVGLITRIQLITDSGERSIINT